MIKYLYILIGVLLLGAAGAFLIGYLVRKPATIPTTTATITGNGQPVNDYTVGVSGNSTATSSQSGQSGATNATVSATDIAAAYSTIFVSLGAQEVSFIPVQSSSDPKFGSVYALYKSDIAIAEKYAVPGQNIALDMASVDLNQAGTAEVLVYENLPGFCGSGGCEFDIYTKIGSSWKKIYGALIAGEVGLLNSYTDGYQDLAIGTNTGDNPRSIMGRYTWNGSSYTLASTLAVWNGQQFIPLK